MAINAANGSTITVNATKLRYSFNLNCIRNAKNGTLVLQRTDKKEDGTWIDDPTPNSRKTIPIILCAELDALLAFLPTILQKLNFTTTYTDYRVNVNGYINLKGQLKVSLTILVKTETKWEVFRVQDLTQFLTTNTDIAESLNTAWDAYDAVIDSSNNTNKWL